MNSIILHNQEFQIQRFDDDFILLKNEKSPFVFQIGQAILDQQFYFIDDVIATETEICLTVNHHFSNESLSYLQSIVIESERKVNVYRIPVYFDAGNDWELIEQQSKLSKENIIQQLLELELSIAMFGFQPGFVYLNGLPEQLHVPRKDSPSLKMKPNTIAIGGPYIGIYSLASPGGWNSIGEIACSIFDKAQNPPLLLHQSDHFQLKVINEIEYKMLQQQNLTITQYNEID